MTPLAHNLTRQMNLDDEYRRPAWRGQGDDLRDALWGIHCFEVTQVIPLGVQIGECLNTPADILADRLFLPAPRTWIEFCPAVRGRMAVLLEGQKKTSSGLETAKVWAFWSDHQRYIGHVSLDRGLLNCRLPGVGDFPVPQHWADWAGEGDFDESLMDWCQVFLYIINSPKIIGRRQHMPHRGLERELVGKTRNGKRFPLEAWSEIILEARPTYIDDSGVEHEAHLTGRKCLHFCRAHVRIRNGKLEIVGHHWRGDASLGIKKSRYKVVPPASRPRRASRVQ